MHRNKPREMTWTEFYKGVPDAWKQAMRELVEFIFEDAPQYCPALSRQQQMHHRPINARLDQLHELVTELTNRKWKYRTRFGDKKLPCSECTQNRYNKLSPQENLAALARVFGGGKGKGLEEGLFESEVVELDDATGHVYLPLHTYSVEGRTTEKHDLPAALKAYFTEVGADSEVDGVFLRLYLAEDDRSGDEDAEREVWEKVLPMLKKNISKIEKDRKKFKDKCEEYYPLFDKLRKVFAMGANDDGLVRAKRQRVDDDGSGEEEESESDPDEGDEVDDNNQYDLHDVHHEMDHDEHVQQIDNHFCEVRRAMGVHPPRLTSFRGDIVQHTPELFYAMCSPHCCIDDRIPYVKAPTFKIGADLKWLKQKSERGYLCKFKKPKESPLQGEVIKAHLNTMPRDEASPIIHAYLELQTMARELNIRTRSLFRTIGNTFDLVICLGLKGGDRNDTVLPYTATELNNNIAQELCLFYVYMNAIYKIPENNPDHALEDEVEQAVAAADAAESEADSDADFEPDEEEGEEEEDDDDDDDADNSNASDEYSDESNDSNDDDDTPAAAPAVARASWRDYGK